MNKRQQIINVLSALAQLCEDWNDAAADDDRGRDQALLVLALWEDGSGRIGTTHDYGKQNQHFVDLTINTQQVFENVEHAADYLLEWVESSEAWNEGLCMCEKCIAIRERLAVIQQRKAKRNDHA